MVTGNQVTSLGEALREKVEPQMADLTITEYTDPGCPFAWSAEPSRWRLRWLYGDQLEWRLRMIGLAEDGAVYEEKGFTAACPSYEIVRNSDGASLSVPGFQPLAAYEVAVANLAPGASRREDPDDVREVLEWAGEPLATIEVATICATDLADARERLGRVADEAHLGFDGLWHLEGVVAAAA